MANAPSDAGYGSIDATKAQPYPGFASSDENVSSTQDSLIRMIQNEYFHMPMALHYLVEKPELGNPLCARMAQYTPVELEFFLPQLLSIYLSNPGAHGPLKQFLLRTAGHNLHFGFLAMMLLRSETGSIQGRSLAEDPAFLLLEDFRRCKMRSRSEDDSPPLSPRGSSRGLSPAIPETIEPATPTRKAEMTKLMLGSDSPPLSARGSQDRARTPTPTNEEADDEHDQDGDGEDTRELGLMPRLGALTTGQRRGHRRTKSDVVHSPIRRAQHQRAESVILVPQGGLKRRQYSSSSSRLADWFSQGVQASLPNSPLGSKSWLHGSRNSLDSGKLFDEQSLSSRTGLDEDELGSSLAAQQAFIDTLIEIGDDLLMLKTKDQRRVQLQALLSKLNLNLPARVYMPLCGQGQEQLASTNHFVVHIPPQEAVVLNSKDKVPYMIQVEVVQCDDFLLSELPPKFGASRPRAIRHVRSFSDGQSRRTDDVHGHEAHLKHLLTPPSTAEVTSSSASAETSPDASLRRSIPLSAASTSSAPADMTKQTNTDKPELVQSQDTLEATSETSKVALSKGTVAPESKPSEVTTSAPASTEPASSSSQADSNTAAETARSRFFSWSFFSSRKSPRKAPMAAVAEVSSPGAEDKPMSAPVFEAETTEPGAEIQAGHAQDAISSESEAAADRAPDAGGEDVAGLESEQSATATATPVDAPLQAKPSVFATAASDEQAAEQTEAAPLTTTTPALKTMDIRRRLSQAANTPENQFQQGSADPSALRSKEDWGSKVKRIRRMSPYGHLRSWHLISAIVKTGDDLRQELLATQLLKLFQKVFKAERLALWLRPLQILVTSNNSGLIEVIGSAVSLHQTKRRSGDSLLAYFEQEFGPRHSEKFMDAQVRKRAASSRIQAYLLGMFVSIKLNVCFPFCCRRSLSSRWLPIRSSPISRKSKTAIMATLWWIRRATSYTLTTASFSATAPVGTWALRRPRSSCCRTLLKSWAAPSRTCSNTTACSSFAAFWRPASIARAL
eukprot:TRINITY_DN11621_c0_g1_i11.p1 TRINITY_DN11621_c0_g1~~TRINITY_DN11621_c0_g1_i11.p1  ORF type:complete len:1015 (+),score=215.08 TRINITY_DN11621_c0_g1_i11:2219-5263(+)